MSDERNPVQKLSRLMNRLREDGRPVGLELQQFLVAPNWDQSAPATAQAIFILSEDEKPLSIEVTEQFSKEMEDFQKQQDEEKARKTREELESLRDELKDPKKGIGLD